MPRIDNSLRITGRCEDCGQPASRLIWARTPPLFVVLERHRFCDRCGDAWWNGWYAALAVAS